MKRVVVVVAAVALAVVCGSSAACDLVFGPREIAGKPCAAGQCPDGFACSSTNVCEATATNASAVKTCAPRCTSNADCTTAGATEVCVDGHCEGAPSSCTANADCTSTFGANAVCLNASFCVPGCTSDADCGTSGTHCDPVRRICQICLSDGDCASQKLTHCIDIGASSGVHAFDGFNLCGCVDEAQCHAAGSTGDVCAGGLCGCSADSACPSTDACVAVGG